MTTVTIVLVGCGDAKREERAPAKDLYTSTYFAKKWAVAEILGDVQKILSAKHTLVDPDQSLEPYDASLSPRSESYIGDARATAWDEKLRYAIREHVLPSYPVRDVAFVVLAGEDYAKHLDPLVDDVDASFEFPFRGLGGLPGQMRWMTDVIKEAE